MSENEEIDETYFLYAYTERVARSAASEESEKEKAPKRKQDADPPENADDDGKDVENKPSPGPGVPMIPEHGSPDANPIDPRVFTTTKK